MSLLLETMKAAHTARRADVTVGGWRMRVRSYGPPGAPPLVLVHGLAMSSLYMTPTALRLAGEFEVSSPELPGFGRSERPKRSLDVPELADLLAEFLHAQRWGPVPLLGNSMGCQILIDLAQRYPEQVACLVLVGPTMDPKHSCLEQIGRLAFDGLLEAPSLVAVAAYDYLRTGSRRFWTTFQLALADPVASKLPELRQPVLVVRGARDPIVSQGWAEEMVRLLPRGRLAVIPGAPHGVNYSAPDDLARLVRPFLRGSL